MAAQPRGITNRQSLAGRAFGSGERVVSTELDGSTTVDTIKIGNPYPCVSFQRIGTIEANVEFSINGVTFGNTTAVATDAVFHFNSHIVAEIKITRTAGSGKIVFALA